MSTPQSTDPTEPGSNVGNSRDDTGQFLDGGPRMTLTCYNDTFGYGWRHVDLFTRDIAGRELNWVHWTVFEDGPDAADEITAQVEPTLRRTSGWRHQISAGGMDYWEADAEWAESVSS